MSTKSKRRAGWMAAALLIAAVLWIMGRSPSTRAQGISIDDEAENSDGCEMAEKVYPGGDGHDPCDKYNPGPDHASPEPPEGGGDPCAPPAGEGESGVDGSGKHPEASNGSGESRPDAQGTGGDALDPEAPPETGDKQPGNRDAAEGSSGNVGGPEDGDGLMDRKAGECDGWIVVERVDSCAVGTTPHPVNPMPLGGALGNNPGFLNNPVVFRYRGFSVSQGAVGLGWDANIFERLILGPQRNPGAAIAWYPGSGACHYFFGAAGGPYTPEPAIQDTHQPIQVDPNSTVFRYKLADKYGNLTFFDVAGRLTKKADRLGNTNIFGRDPVTGRLLTVSSSYGHTSMWTFGYYPSGLLQSATDYSGRQSTWTYDANGRLVTFSSPPSTLHPNGKTFQFEYYVNSGNPAADGKLKRILDPVGVTRVEFGYDGQGFATTLARGNGLHQLTVSRNGNTRDVTDFNGNLRRYTFQAGLHHPIRVELFTRGLRTSDPASYVWAYEFNPQRQITRAVMPSGKTYDFTYDASFNRTRRRVTGVGGTQTADWTWTYGAFNLAGSVTDPLGHTWNYTRDANGLITSVTTPDPGTGAATYRYEYNSFGQLQKVTNSLGRTKTYTRFPAGNFFGWVQSVTYGQEGGGTAGTCGSGQTYTYTCNSRGYPLTVTDPGSGRVTVERDEVDRVTQVYTNAPIPTVVKTTYNLQGIPTIVQMENRNDAGVLDSNKPWVSASILYDARRRVVGVTRDFDSTTNQTWALERDGLGRMTKETSPEGRIAQFAYDERGYLLSSARGVTQPITQTVAYHVGGAVREVKNALGHAVLTGVDVFDRIVSQTSPTGEVSSRTLDLFGRVLVEEMRDSSNILYARSSRTYDNRNRVSTRTLDRFGHGPSTEYATWGYAYDLDSNVIGITTPLGRTYSHTYYSCGKPLSDKDDQTNGRVEYTYDDRGLLIRSRRTETEGGTTKVYTRERSYDLNGRLVQESEIDADNSANVLTTSYTYDSIGRLATVTGPSQEFTRYTYNYAGLVVDMLQRERRPPPQNPIEHHTTYEWGKDGNLKSVTDPTGAKTDYEYTEHGLLKMVKQPDGTSTTCTFDAAGRVATVTDNNGTVTTNSYDSAGRLTGRTVNRAPGVIGTTTETYVYDGAGRLFRASDDDSVVELAYDSLGNVLSEKQGPNPSQLTTIAGSYDIEGSPTGLTYPGGLALGFTIDSAGRFQKVLQGTGPLLERSYVQSTLLSTQATAGGTSLDTWSHDGFARLSRLQFQQVPGQGPVVTQFDVDYGYDASHRRLYERRRHAGNSGDLYSYDDLGRTTRVLQGVADPVAELQNPGSQTFVTNVGYTFNAVGNRTQVAKTPFGGTPTTTSYTSNNLHQYTSVGGTGWTHDANGNVVGNGTFTFKYDYRNHIVEVRRQSDSALIAVYFYDAFGRRVRKSVEGAGSNYFHWGHNPIEIRDDSGTVTHQFVHPDGVDDLSLLVRRDTADYDQDGNVTEYLLFTYHRDAIGSVRAITDITGAIAETYSYDEYGNATIRNGAGQTVSTSVVGNMFTFTAREFDAETGLLFYRARFYAPSAGAFLQRDPLGFASGFDPYSYVCNSPFTYIDPLGLWGWPSWVKSSAKWVGDRAHEFALGWEATSAGDLVKIGAQGGGAIWCGVAESLSFGVIDVGVAAELQPVKVIGAWGTDVVTLAVGVGELRTSLRGTKALVSLADDAAKGVEKIVVRNADDIARAAESCAGAARGTAATAKELNKIAHVFPRAEKSLEGLVAASGGSELNALRAVQAAANQALAEGRLIAGPNGILPGNAMGAVLDVNGVNVQLIGGRVMNGTVELGSFVGLP